MVHRFVTSAAQARALTKLSKKEKFYFRTLVRTDHNVEVECEVTEKGYFFIVQNNINVNWK